MRISPPTLRYLTTRVGHEDHAAFRCLYELLAPTTLASIREHLPDPVQSMHVLRGTFCEVWWMCAFDVRCRAPRRDVARWVDAVAAERRVERVRTLDLMAAESQRAEPTSVLVGFMEDLDMWTQFQLAAMLDGHDTVAVPVPPDRRDERPDTTSLCVGPTSITPVPGCAPSTFRDYPHKPVHSADQPDQALRPA